MALSILDGNQTATTLSTVISAGAHIPAHTVVSLGTQAKSDITSAISGSVVSISNFPFTQTIAGTVTANIGIVNDSNFNYNSDKIMVAGGVEQLSPEGRAGGIAIDSNNAVIVSSVTIGSLPAISGTVTATLYLGQGFALEGNESSGALYVEQVGSVTIGSLPAISGVVTANLSSVPTHGVTIANTSVTVNGTFYQATQPVSLTSTTVTVSALPSGALTTRFGSVTTANLAQISSAVTNTSRKYLLCQNISSGTVTIGIGFSPTTTQGIQLSAGGGLSFDAFCPTGAVWWLSATTGANFTILEG